MSSDGIVSSPGGTSPPSLVRRRFWRRELLSCLQESYHLLGVQVAGGGGALVNVTRAAPVGSDLGQALHLNALIPASPRLISLQFFFYLLVRH